METPARSIPAVTTETAPFFKSAAEGRLEIQKCSDCGRYQHYPRRFCTSCLSANIGFVPVSGRGTVYTFTICRIPGHPSMQERVPYAIAMIDLEEGPRLMAGIEGDARELAIGSTVDVVFEALTDDIALPMFRLSAKQEAASS